MEFKKESFIGCDKNLNEDQIKKAENDIKVKFPISFIEFLVNLYEKTPALNTQFSYYDLEDRNTKEVEIDFFLTIGDSPFSIKNEVNNIYRQLPDGLIPFAISDTINFICFDYRSNYSSDNPSIVFWKYGAEESRSISFVAKNFDAFIWLLKESDNNNDEKLDEGRINQIESEIGFKLPKAFLRYIENCEGETPLACEFEYFDTAFQESWGAGIGCFLSLRKARNSLLKLFKDPPEFFPEGLVAFADTGGGDFICFDYRKCKDNPDPEIVYWNHEADIGKDVSFVAKNFEEFLSILKEPEDDE